MSTLYSIASFVFFLWVLRNILFWSALWQVKEYRLDRFLVHFWETSKGRDVLYSPISFIKWVTVITYVVVSFYPFFLYPYQLFVTLLLSFDGFFTMWELYSRRLRRPIFTVRASSIGIASLLLVGFLYANPLLEKFFWLLLLNRSIPLIVWVFVLLTAIPSEFMKDFLVARAAKKMQRQKGIRVIGVSGSYGKSSTKEYTAQILSKKFRVVKTYGSHNTPIGVARAILGNINSSTEVFVVEIGSYRKGEVAELCQIVRPRISITTAISDQHLSLYGSFQNILDTEYELVDSLPKDGLSLFNGNSAYSYSLYKKTKKKKILYGTNQIQNQRTIDYDISARNISVQKTGLYFDAIFGGEVTPLKTPLLGGHNVENILPGVYIAYFLGMKKREIQEAVYKLYPLPKTMVRLDSAKKFVIIDDTFNASPESVRAALEYMKVFSRKKFLVLEPMIELGPNADIDHYAVAKEVASLCNYLFLTNNNHYASIARGIKDGRGRCKIMVGNSNKIAQMINSLAKKGDIVVLEGRETSLVMPKII